MYCGTLCLQVRLTTVLFHTLIAVIVCFIVIVCLVASHVVYYILICSVVILLQPFTESTMIPASNQCFISHCHLDYAKHTHTTQSVFVYICANMSQTVWFAANQVHELFG